MEIPNKDFLVSIQVRLMIDTALGTILFVADHCLKKNQLHPGANVCLRSAEHGHDGKTVSLPTNTLSFHRVKTYGIHL